MTKLQTNQVLHLFVLFEHRNEVYFTWQRRKITITTKHRGKDTSEDLLMWVDVIYRTLAMTSTVLIDLQLESLSEKYMCNRNIDLQLCYFYPGYVFVII